jgi:hypothetical protein
MKAHEFYPTSLSSFRPCTRIEVVQHVRLSVMSRCAVAQIYWYRNLYAHWTREESSAPAQSSSYACQSESFCNRQIHLEELDHPAMNLMHAALQI